MALREELREAIEKGDRVIVIVTVLVWVSITIYAVLLVASSGIAGGGIAFIVYVVALLVWGKLVKDWMEERKRQIERVSYTGMAEEEIRRLREAIERLRESLES